MCLPPRTRAQSRRRRCRARGCVSVECECGRGRGAMTMTDRCHDDGCGQGMTNRCKAEWRCANCMRTFGARRRGSIPDPGTVESARLDWRSCASTCWMNWSKPVTGSRPSSDEIQSAQSASHSWGLCWRGDEEEGARLPGRRRVSGSSVRSTRGRVGGRA